MPEDTPTIYLQATRGYGASIVLTTTMADAFKAVSRYIAEGWTYVHPFDDPLVIAGHYFHCSHFGRSGGRRKNASIDSALRRKGFQICCMMKARLNATERPSR